MKILFWNLKKNSIEKWLEELIKEQDIDIVILAEYDGISMQQLLNDLHGDYKQYDGYDYCKKITLIAKNDISVTVKREQGRYVLYSVTTANSAYIIAGIHLSAKPYADTNTRKCEIRTLVQDICELENKEKSWKTVVIGDFNCNPFDEELIQKDSFNTVLFKKVIEKHEFVVYCGRKYRRFYNPIINYLKEETETYGSYYYSAGSAPLIWNCFDQILVRKIMRNSIGNIEYCKSINGKRLLKDVRPNFRISDHLPLVCEIMEG